jgi:hypothetical protein
MEVIELPVLEERDEGPTQIEQDIDLTALRYWREASRPDVVGDESSEP